MGTASMFEVRICHCLNLEKIRQRFLACSRREFAASETFGRGKKSQKVVPYLTRNTVKNFKPNLVDDALREIVVKVHLEEDADDARSHARLQVFRRGVRAQLVVEVTGDAVHEDAMARYERFFNCKGLYSEEGRRA